MMLKISSRILALILMILYSGPMRSSELIKEIRKELEDVSDQSIYNALKKMQETGLIRKVEIGPRNVEYEITEKGKALVEEEYLKTRDTLISLIRHSVRHEEILAEVLIADLLEKVPKGLEDPHMIQVLRNHFRDQLEGMIASTTALLRSLSVRS